MNDTHLDDAAEMDRLTALHGAGYATAHLAEQERVEQAQQERHAAILADVQFREQLRETAAQQRQQADERDSQASHWRDATDAAMEERQRAATRPPCAAIAPDASKVGHTASRYTWQSGSWRWLDLGRVVEVKRDSGTGIAFYQLDTGSCVTQDEIECGTIRFRYR